MRIGWLHDQTAYLGGAEMTCREFRIAGPGGIIDCPPGAVESGCDLYVVNNVVTYLLADLERIDAPVYWYHHDLSPWIKGETRAWLDENARHIFCSPPQRDRYGLDGACIPPPVNLDAFRPTRQARKHRWGAVSIAQWRNPGKGGQRIIEWAQENGPIDAWGDGDMPPVGPNVNFRGPIAPERVASVLYDYETFVFLPVEFEPFGRCVAEAWASGCELVVNRNIGAAYWISENPEAIDTAAEDFWRVVLG